MPETVLMEEMTWTQIRAAIASGKNVAVVACGAVEQHGPHLPTGTDSLLGTAIAVRAARKSGNALVAPTIRPGLSQHHMHFPGSLTLRPQTFVALLEDYCASLAGQGFRRIVIFPSHGGNVDMMRAHLPYLAAQLKGQCELSLSTASIGRSEQRQRWLDEAGITPARAGAHGGYVETSMVLAERPELVDMDQAAPGLVDASFYEPQNLARSQMQSFLGGIHSQSANGVLGDPTGSSPDSGEQLLEMASDALARDLAAAAAGAIGQQPKQSQEEAP